MGLSSYFSFLGSNVSADELPEIFPMSVAKSDFIQTDVFSIYYKIITDVLERTQGIPEAVEPSLWDNCVKSASSDGLVTLLAKAMTDKKDLFLTYDPALGLLREAKGQEAAQIKTDYEKQGESALGVYVSFKNFSKSDMLKLYSSLEYCTIASLNKSANLSSAVQVKISDLRSSTGLNDARIAKAQASEIAKALASGRTALLDAKDVIETSKPDLTAVENSMKVLNEKRSFYLGLPASYISGTQTGGIGSTGEADTKATERGLKFYFFSIVKPVCETLFGASLTYKSQDFRQISQALEAMKTFELTSEELLSVENKRSIVEVLLDIDPAENKTVAATDAPQVQAR